MIRSIAMTDHEDAEQRAEPEKEETVLVFRVIRIGDEQSVFV